MTKRFALTHRAFLTLQLAAALCGVAIPVGGRAQQGSVQVIETEVISVPVTVADRRGKFVLGLNARDFGVAEDGVPQEVTSFAVEDSGVAAVLVLDSSGSMATRIGDVKRAAIQFVQQMGPNDVASVIQFDTKVSTLIDFSGDKARLESAVNGIGVGGNTALHNALWTALAGLDGRRAEDEASKRHRAIILLTDGADTGSGITADEVRVRARRTDALIYALSLDHDWQGRPVTEGPTPAFLRQLAEQTGGRLIFPDVSNLRRLYSDISEELHHQYMLGYISNSTSSRTGWRSIGVTVKGNQNYRIRHRQGYYASGARSTR